MFLAAVVEEEKENPLIPAYYDLLWGSVCFAVLLIFFLKYVMPRLRQIEALRIEGIEAKLEKAEADRVEAEALLVQYREQLADARHEASRLREDARVQGATILAEMREEAQAESTRLVGAAQTQVNADRQQAYNELRTQVGELATALAGRIVGESLQDRALQSRVVDRFLDEIETTSAPTRTSRPAASLDGESSDGAPDEGAATADADSSGGSHAYVPTSDG